MAKNRPDRPFAANIQVMQRSFFVQTSIGRIRVLQNFVAENHLFSGSDNHGHLHQRFSVRKKTSTLMPSLTQTVWGAFAESPHIRWNGPHFVGNRLGNVWFKNRADQEPSVSRCQTKATVCVFPL